MKRKKLTQWQERMAKRRAQFIEGLREMLKDRDERIAFLEQERHQLLLKNRQYAQINATISEAWRSLNAALDVIRGLKRKARAGKERSYVRPTGERK